MKLSFILIAYNEERTIGPALDSVFAQTALPAAFEVIVVNDGSMDATSDVVRAYQLTHPQLRLIDMPVNRGRGAARAAGSKAAKGDLLAFVDSDIILPVDWFDRCNKCMSDFDACAGTAVPDGDVSWIYNTFQLPPKIAPHQTVVTGSNSLFKRQVFNRVMFKETKKDGEDVDLNYQMAAAGIKVTTAPDVVVEHRESKDYLTSLGWLYVTGLGATRQWYEQRTIRTPDISFLLFLLLIVSSLAILLADPQVVVLLAVLLLLSAFITLTSSLHLQGKFYLARKPLTALQAVIVNDTLLLAYFIGRLVGIGKLRGAKS